MYIISIYIYIYHLSKCSQSVVVFTSTPGRFIHSFILVSTFVHLLFIFCCVLLPAEEFNLSSVCVEGPPPPAQSSMWTRWGPAGFNGPCRVQCEFNRQPVEFKVNSMGPLLSSGGPAEITLCSIWVQADVNLNPMWGQCLCSIWDQCVLKGAREWGWVLAGERWVGHMSPTSLAILVGPIL